MVLHQDNEVNNKLINKSRMMGDYQVRFCERVEAKASALLDCVSCDKLGHHFVSQAIKIAKIGFENSDLSEL
jgi:hypothetical protein